MVRILQKCDNENFGQQATLGIERGVRQECPLSASLYIIYLQLFLGIMVRKDAIQGIEVPGGVMMMSALVLFCNDQSYLSKIFFWFDKVLEIQSDPDIRIES